MTTNMHMKVAAFAKWFNNRARDMRAGIKTGPFSESLASEISREVQKLHERLRWEIGPHDGDLFFAFGCGGNADLLRVGKEIVSQLPHIPGWTFLPAKPRKQAGRRLLFRRADGNRTVDFEKWEFAIEESERSRLTVRLRPVPKSDLEGDELEGLGWMIVDFELGEELVIESIANIEMVESFDSEAQAIGSLFQAIEAQR